MGTTLSTYDSWFAIMRRHREGLTVDVFRQELAAAGRTLIIDLREMDRER